MEAAGCGAGAGRADAEPAVAAADRSITVAARKGRWLASGSALAAAAWCTPSVGIVAVVITVLKVSESKSPHARRPDWAGFVLWSLALASLIYALIASDLFLNQ